MSHDHDAHSDEEHAGLGLYLAVGAGLGLLTAISFAAGSSTAIMSTPALGWTIMIAVSCAKALLVMMVFMHLIWEANWKYVLTVPASIMSLFLLLMLVPDVGLRTRHYTEERLLSAPRPASYSLLEEDARRKGEAPPASAEHH